MIQIDNLSDDADQTTEVVLDDGSVVQFEFNFLPAVQLWMMNVTYGSFQANGITLVSHPNILREFRNNIPFGLALTSADGFDPLDISDFISGRIVLYVLTQSDVADLEASTFGVGA
jgi:hypothetical protein